MVGLFWCVEQLFSFLQSGIEAADVNEATRIILIPMLENLRDLIREVASLLPAGHGLIVCIYELSEAIANFLFDIGVR